MFLMAGCNNKDVSPVDADVNNKVAALTNDDTIHHLEGKVVELEKIIEKQQQAIEEHEEKLMRLEEIDSSTNWIDNLYEMTISTDSKLYELETLINQVTSSKTAMINDVAIHGNTINLNITYTNMIVGNNEGPSGFRLEETEEGTVDISVSNDVPVFLLKDPGTLIPASFEELSEYQKFVRLFEKDGEIVYISELYLP